MAERSGAALDLNTAQFGNVPSERPSERRAGALGAHANGSCRSRLPGAGRLQLGRLGQVHAVVAAHGWRVVAAEGVEDTDRVGFVSSSAAFSERLEPLQPQIRSSGSLVVMDMINNQVLSCSERISIMPENIFNCLAYSDDALAKASESTEPDRAALIAQAQASAIEAVAIALARLGDRVEDLVSVVQQLQR